LLAIIQARLDSKRFPGKSLKKIYGKSMLERVYNRVKKAKEIKKVIIAIPKNKNNIKLENFCLNNNFSYYKGSLKNVCERMYETAKKSKSKAFVRICGDSPLIDPYLIDYAVKIFNKKKIDLVTNTFKRSCPSGQSIEVVKTTTLKKILDKRLTPEEKEHVTKFFYNNIKNYKVYNFKIKNIRFKKLKFSVDTKKDLKILLNKFNKKKFDNFNLIKK
jgi:spore coat polysaccharide biosynthesis protein SpsF